MVGFALDSDWSGGVPEAGAHRTTAPGLIRYVMVSIVTARSQGIVVPRGYT